MHTMPLPRQGLGLAGWLILSFAAAAIGAIASADAASFYRELTLPAWAPPAWLFAPVWSVLYLLMGIAAWMVWRTRGLHDARGAFTLFILQLAANALWTWLFFAWQRGAWAMADILVLWVLIAATIRAFWHTSRTAGALLLPYIAWVSFATALTWACWQLNPQLLG